MGKEDPIACVVVEDPAETALLKEYSIRDLSEYGSRVVELGR